MNAQQQAASEKMTAAIVDKLNVGPHTVARTVEIVMPKGEVSRLWNASFSRTARTWLALWKRECRAHRRSNSRTENAALAGCQLQDEEER